MSRTPDSAGNPRQAWASARPQKAQTFAEEYPVRIQGEATRKRARRVRCCSKGAVPSATPTLAQRVGQRGASQHDQRNDRRDQPQIREGDPERQLVGPVRGDVEHASHQAGLGASAGDNAVHRIEQESDEEQDGADEPERRRSQIQDREA